MLFKKPLFWDLKKPNLISYLLSPFTLPIILNNFFLKFKSKIKSKEIKTICVGNIYLGGTGKTPTTITIYETLKEMNFSDINELDLLYLSKGLNFNKDFRQLFFNILIYSYLDN